MHPNRVCRDQNRHNRAATADNQSKLVEIQTPRYRQLARNYSVFVRPASCMRGCGRDSLRKSSIVALHVKFTIVLPSPAAQRSYVQARPLFICPFLYVFKPPHLVCPASQSNYPLVYRIVSSRIESSRRVAIAVLSYYRRCNRRSQAVIKRQFRRRASEDWARS
jgi:hypothetical protein